MRLLGDGHSTPCPASRSSSESGKGLSRGLMLVPVSASSRGTLVFEVQ